MRPRRWRIPLIGILLGIGACSAQRPVLYPNEQYTQQGKEAADAAIDDCLRRAEEHTSSSASATGAGRDVATGTAVGAGTGAAAGAVGGAITGNPGQGAAVGAASGATAGLLYGLFGMCSSRPGPDPTFAAFVDRCLRDKGYDPIGWE